MFKKEIIRSIMERYEAGETKEMLRKEFGFAGSTFDNWRTKYRKEKGIKSRKSYKLSPSKKKEIFFRRRSGETLENIAKDFDVTPQAIAAIASNTPLNLKIENEILKKENRALKKLLKIYIDTEEDQNG